mmetsp:Transcript_33317/g.60844  ORF Transcript_33317/g.60844 Transcript_33317/m.60844 type:complete len:355 (+) Transcript_33317:445-1509(+)
MPTLWPSWAAEGPPPPPPLLQAAAAAAAAWVLRRIPAAAAAAAAAVSVATCAVFRACAASCATKVSCSLALWASARLAVCLRCSSPTKLPYSTTCLFKASFSNSQSSSRLKPLAAWANSRALALASAFASATSSLSFLPAPPTHSSYLASAFTHRSLSRLKSSPSRALASRSCRHADLSRSASPCARDSKRADSPLPPLLPLPLLPRAFKSCSSWALAARAEERASACALSSSLARSNWRSRVEAICSAFPSSSDTSPPAPWSSPSWPPFSWTFPSSTWPSSSPSSVVASAIIDTDGVQEDEDASGFTTEDDCTAEGGGAGTWAGVPGDSIAANAWAPPTPEAGAAEETGVGGT